MADSSSQKKVLHDPAIGSIFLFIIIGVVVFFVIKNENSRDFMIQSIEKVTQLMSK